MDKNSKTTAAEIQEINHSIEMHFETIRNMLKDSGFCCRMPQNESCVGLYVRK